MVGDGRQLGLLPMLICAALLAGAALSACSPLPNRAPCPGLVSEVTYIAHSGPVVAPWTETVLISRAVVMFERGGEPGGNVNIGAWELDVDPEAIDRLFEELGAVDCRPIQEIEPEAPVDGSGSELYEIEYDGGGAFALWYVEGATYRGADVITDPIQAFIEQFPPPPEAVDRFIAFEDF